MGSLARPREVNEFVSTTVISPLRTLAHAIFSVNIQLVIIRGCIRARLFPMLTRKYRILENGSDYDTLTESGIKPMIPLKK